MPREIRPRFELRREEPAGALLDRVAARLRAEGAPLCGFVADDRIELYVPPSRQRLWSPELRVDVAREGDVTVLRCQYAPHPHVWITYVAALGALLVGLIAVVTFALVEWSMHERPVALYALPPLVALAVATYGLAFVGQGFASEEMDELCAFLEEWIDSGAALPSHVRSLKPSAQPEPSAASQG